MKAIVSVLGIVMAFTLFSFKENPPAKKLTLKTGTYGVCGCGDAGDNNMKAELTINDDNTFHYFDNTNPSKKIDVKGNWTMNNNTIILKNYSSEASIHNKWAIDDNEKCLKSRKGLNFTRLCHIKSCQ